MNVAAIATTSRRNAPAERRTAPRAGEGRAVPVQLGRPDRPGSVPALARVLAPDRLELRCSRPAIALLAPDARFVTPETLPPLRARVYLPQRPSSEPALVACVPSEVVVSEDGEFVLRGNAVDVSPEDRFSLSQFCSR